MSFVRVCALDRLTPERGVAVIIEGQQIALFRVVVDGATVVYAVGHYDPFSGANVMARGIVGSTGNHDTVAAPIFKQVFSLATGECLSDPTKRLPVWRTIIDRGQVYIDIAFCAPDSRHEQLSRTSK